MRLLYQEKVDGPITFEEVENEDNAPPYVILSHRWGRKEDEVEFDDMIQQNASEKLGYTKIKFCARRAQAANCKYFWVDTCCINKRDLPERNEAIRSMFRWYKKAYICFVYLNDVSKTLVTNNFTQHHWQDKFRQSSWFKRSWTLQELLAPSKVEFWSHDDQSLGTKLGLSSLITEITGIPARALCGPEFLSDFHPNDILRWAYKREATKLEDKAYSLYGIFEGKIDTPLVLYGEKEKAMIRLKKMIGTNTYERQETSAAAEPGSSSIGSECAQILTPATIESRRKELFKSLHFEQMDARRSAIKDPRLGTCEWLLEHETYKKWNSRDKPPRHHEILLISGKPGTGKSTLMNFALTHAYKNKRDDEILLSFFFNARGEELEKSTVGMYRSLVYNLLHQAEDLKQTLTDELGPHFELTPSFAWTVQTLQKVLCAAVPKLGRRRLICFIDALDECEDDQIREMVLFLKDLGSDSLKGDTRFYVCFACRYYPVINIEHGGRLDLQNEDGHKDDLMKYIRRHLQVKKYRNGEELLQQVHQNANGVFMWAVLVIPRLAKVLESGRILDVEMELKKFPKELGELYRNLMYRDRDAIDDVLLCLQCILFAKRPLSIKEFYFAFWAGKDRITQEVLNHAPKESVMEDLLHEVSRGLAELTHSRNEKKPGRVQFIHESVRDFLLQQNGLYGPWPHLREDLLGKSHERLKNCCCNFLAVKLSDFVNIPSELPEAKSKAAIELEEKTAEKLPFLEYAYQYVFYHANEAARNVSQLEFLRKFDLQNWVQIANLFERVKVRRHKYDITLSYILAEYNYSRLLGELEFENKWERLSKQRYQFPVLAAFGNGHVEALQALLGADGDAFIDGIGRDPGFGKPFELTSRKDPICWAMMSLNQCLAECLLSSFSHWFIPLKPWRDNIEQALTRAVRWGWQRVVQLCLEKDHTLRNDHKMLNDVLISAFTNDSVSEIMDLLHVSGNYDPTAPWRTQKKPSVETLKMLLAAGATIDGHSPQFCNALFNASKLGHEDLVRLLIDEGVKIDDTILGAAITGCNAETVELLIEKALDVDNLAPDHDRVLITACRRGNEAVVQLLIEHDADINAEGQLYGSALIAAAEGGHEKILDLLLDAGAEVNIQGRIHRTGFKTPGHYRAVPEPSSSSRSRSLSPTPSIENGVDPSGRYALDGERGTALRAASYRGHEAIIKRLLDCGAEIDAQDKRFGTALYAAALRGHTTTVQLLLEQGACINANGGKYHYALTAATNKGHDDVVGLLLSKSCAGHDLLNQPDAARALFAALYANQLPVVQFLVEKNAEVYREAGSLGTILIAASELGREPVVRLLISKKVDVDHEGHGRFSCALEAACFNGHVNIIRMLLEEGVEVNGRGVSWGTAMRAACSKGHDNIVQILLDCGADIGAAGREDMYGSPLHAASSNGHVGVLELLRDELKRRTKPISNTRDGQIQNLVEGNHQNGAQACSSQNIVVHTQARPLDTVEDSQSGGKKRKAAANGECWDDAISLDSDDERTTQHRKIG